MQQDHHDFRHRKHYLRKKNAAASKVEVDDLMELAFLREHMNRFIGDKTMKCIPLKVAQDTVLREIRNVIMERYRACRMSDKHPKIQEKVNAITQVIQKDAFLMSCLVVFDLNLLTALDYLADIMHDHSPNLDFMECLKKFGQVSMDKKYGNDPCPTYIAEQVEISNYATWLIFRYFLHHMWIGFCTNIPQHILQENDALVKQFPLFFTWTKYLTESKFKTSYPNFEKEHGQGNNNQVLNQKTCLSTEPKPFVLEDKKEVPREKQVQETLSVLKKQDRPFVMESWADIQDREEEEARRKNGDL